MSKHLRVTVDGKTYDVVVEELGQETGANPAPVASPAGVAAPAPTPAAATPATAPVPAPAPATTAAPSSPPPAAAGADDRTAPLSGIIVEISVAVGDQVKVDQPVAVMEAMKMKTVIGAHKAGKVTAIYVGPGDGVEADQPLMSIA